MKRFKSLIAGVLTLMLLSACTGLPGQLPEFGSTPTPESSPAVGAAAPAPAVSETASPPAAGSGSSETMANPDLVNTNTPLRVKPAITLATVGPRERAFHD